MFANLLSAYSRRPSIDEENKSHQSVCNVNESSSPVSESNRTSIEQSLGSTSIEKPTKNVYQNSVCVNLDNLSYKGKLPTGELLTPLPPAVFLALNTPINDVAKASENDRIIQEKLEEAKALNRQNGNGSTMFKFSLWGNASNSISGSCTNPTLPPLTKNSTDGNANSADQKLKSSSILECNFASSTLLDSIPTETLVGPQNRTNVFPEARQISPMTPASDSHFLSPRGSVQNSTYVTGTTPRPSGKLSARLKKIPSAQVVRTDSDSNPSVNAKSTVAPTSSTANNDRDSDISASIHSDQLEEPGQVQRQKSPISRKHSSPYKRRVVGAGSPLKHKALQRLNSIDNSPQKASLNWEKAAAISNLGFGLDWEGCGANSNDSKFIFGTTQSSSSGQPFDDDVAMRNGRTLSSKSKLSASGRIGLKPRSKSKTKSKRTSKDGESKRSELIEMTPDDDEDDSYTSVSDDDGDASKKDKEDRLKHFCVHGVSVSVGVSAGSSPHTLLAGSTLPAAPQSQIDALKSKPFSPTTPNSKSRSSEALELFEIMKQQKAASRSCPGSSKHLRSPSFDSNDGERLVSDLYRELDRYRDVAVSDENKNNNGSRSTSSSYLADFHSYMSLVDGAKEDISDGSDKVAQPPTMPTTPSTPSAIAITTTTFECRPQSFSPNKEGSRLNTKETNQHNAAEVTVSNEAVTTSSVSDSLNVTASDRRENSTLSLLIPIFDSAVADSPGNGSSISLNNIHGVVATHSKRTPRDRLKARALLQKPDQLEKLNQTIIGSGSVTQVPLSSSPLSSANSSPTKRSAAISSIPKHKQTQSHIGSHGRHLASIYIEPLPGRLPSGSSNRNLTNASYSSINNCSFNEGLSHRQFLSRSGSEGNFDSAKTSTPRNNQLDSLKLRQDISFSSINSLTTATLNLGVPASSRSRRLSQRDRDGHSKSRHIVGGDSSVGFQLRGLRINDHAQESKHEPDLTHFPEPKTAVASPSYRSSDQANSFSAPATSSPLPPPLARSRHNSDSLSAFCSYESEDSDQSDDINGISKVSTNEHYDSSARGCIGRFHTAPASVGARVSSPMPPLPNRHLHHKSDLARGIADTERRIETSLAIEGQYESKSKTPISVQKDEKQTPSSSFFKYRRRQKYSLSATSKSLSIIQNRFTNPGISGSYSQHSDGGKCSPNLRSQYDGNGDGGASQNSSVYGNYSGGRSGGGGQQYWADDGSMTSLGGESPSPTANSPGPIRWKRGQLIGEGSFGKVYKGLNERTGQSLAIKQLYLSDSNEEDIAVLQEEIRVICDLDHENIVKYLGTCKTDRHLFILLEYLPGGSIAGMLAQYGPFEEQLILRFGHQILLGLCYLHARGIVHRDIKGSNVLVTDTGVAKLSDFGCSKQLAGLCTMSIEDSEKVIKGSIPWMAPEVIKQVGFGRSSDIWSFGATIIEMATGKPPYSEFTNNLAALFHVAKSDKPPPTPACLSPVSATFLARCMHLDPKSRGSAQELLVDPAMKGVRGRRHGQGLNRSRRPSTGTSSSTLQA